MSTEFNYERARLEWAVPEYKKLSERVKTVQECGKGSDPRDTSECNVLYR